MSDSPIIFLGPTLPLPEAQAILPHGRFCPPVRCGDIVALMRLRPLPGRIAIIDGVFESVGAVWHKEILYALSRGAAVYGAASMGALRAAELAVHGMIGVGPIYQGYLTGELVDDDEVAVLHGPPALGHAVLTDALVNIRATLRRACAAGVITGPAAAAVVAAARRTFYQRRVLAEIVEQMGQDGAPVDGLCRWLATPGSAVDQKRLDAIALLERLARQEERSPVPHAGVPTVFLRNLQCEVACRPFPFAATWLPIAEQLGRTARLLGGRYRLLQRLALALALLDASARSRRLTLEEAMEGCDDGWQVGMTHLVRLFTLDGPAGDDSALDICALLARAWRALEQYLDGIGVICAPSDDELLSYASSLQQRLGLTTQERLDAWLARRYLADRRSYAAFLRHAYRFEHGLNPYMINLYGFFAIDAEQSWLHTALQVTGVADELHRRLSDPPRFAAERAAAWQAVPAAQRDLLAHECDFADFAEVELLLAELASRS